MRMYPLFTNNSLLRLYPFKVSKLMWDRQKWTCPQGLILALFGELVIAFI